MPRTARPHIREMRGGAPAHLLEADDGRFYIVKFKNNPQHPTGQRAGGLGFSDALAACKRGGALIHVREEFIGNNPGVSIELGTKRIRLPRGGSLDRATRATPRK